MTDKPAQPADAPLLRVVHGGDPTADELAALVIALATRTGDAAAPPRSRWADRAAMVRRPLPTGASAWRASARIPGVRTRAGV